MQIDIIRDFLRNNTYPSDLIEPFIHWKIIKTAVDKSLVFKPPKSYTGTQKQIVKRRARLLKNFDDQKTEAVVETMKIVAPNFTPANYHYFIATNIALNEFLRLLYESITATTVLHIPPFMEIVKEKHNIILETRNNNDTIR